MGRLRAFGVAVAFMVVGSLTPHTFGSCNPPKFASTYNPVTEAYVYWRTSINAGTGVGLIGKIWSGSTDYTGTCNNGQQTFLYFAVIPGAVGLSLSLGNACVPMGVCPFGSLSVMAGVTQGANTEFLTTQAPDTPAGALDFDYSTRPHTMVAAPSLQVTGASQNGSNKTFTFAIASHAAGLFDGTAPQITGYNLLVAPGTTDPGRLAANYTPGPLAFGAASGGVAVSVNGTVNCANQSTHYWIAAQLQTAAGPSPFVGPAVQVDCLALCQDADGDGYFSLPNCGTPLDCDDQNPSVHPGAPELCNGIDDNCDGDLDEGLARSPFYRDADGDTYGDPAVSRLACAVPPGFVSNSLDCNDTLATVHPGAPESCNGIDDNCNGQIDEGVLLTFYRDADNDGYGNPLVTTQACSPPSGYVSNQLDCDDSSALVHPGAAEACNGRDDNCNGVIDEGVLLTFYRDADNDGYGNLLVTAQGCSAPAGFVANSTDCDDGNPAIHPGAPEVCNHIDDNCNGQIDDDAHGVDSDGDGIHNACDNCPLLYNASQTDSDGDGVGNVCDNCPFAFNPAQADTDLDGIGDACDACTDSDGDGFGDPGFVENECPDDNCVGIFNPTQSDADADGIGDPCDSCPLDPSNDIDHDGVCGGVDNCPAAYNPGQADGDGDGVGDLCDNCPSVSNHSQADRDSDAVGDSCDNCPDVSNPAQQDTDHDAVGDGCDDCPTDFNPAQTDHDRDGVGDACDNCGLAANSNQADADADGRGDVCDNCPMEFNPNQLDSDEDGVGDVCDNCSTVFNPSQSDVDQNGEGDLCDLHDGLIYVFGGTATNRIEWQREAGVSYWNVYEGDLGILRSGGPYTQAPGSNDLAARACGVTTTSVPDSTSPPAGRVKFWLVTGVTGGVEGSLGKNSSGGIRANTNPCP